MTKIRTIAPTVLAVDLAVAKANLRIDGDDMDALVTTWAKGVIAKLEHETGQCLMEQTWVVRLQAFPGTSCWALGQPAPRQLATEIGLPHPVLAVMSVSYIDQDGVTQPLSEAAYRLNKARFSTMLSPARRQLAGEG